MMNTATVSTIPVISLGFLYTNKCNLSCRHCCNESGPNGNDKLAEEAAADKIREAAELGIRKIVFTGGEPSLYMDEIVRLLAVATSCGLASQVVTNGLWREDVASIESQVETLKISRVGRIGLSLDAFHHQPESLDKIERICRSARRSNIEVGIQEVNRNQHDKKSKEVFISRIMRLGTMANFSGIYPFGRAAKACRQTDFADVLPVWSASHCTTLGQITYTPDGRLIPCCGLSYYDIMKSKDDNACFIIGTIGEKLSDTLQRSHDNIFLSVLGTAGPYGFVLLAREFGHRLVLPDTLSSICEICCHAVGNESFRQLLGLLQERRAEVLPKLREHFQVMKRWGLTSVGFIDNKSLPE